MVTKKLEEFQIKTAEEIAADMMNDLKNSFKQRGIDLTTKGSVYEIDINNVANEIYLATQAFELKANEQMPDTATGEALYRIGRILGLNLKPAGGSIGNVLFSASIPAPLLISEGTTLTDDSGLSYQVTTSGPYVDGYSMEVSSIDTGSITNLAAGALLRWSSPPPFANSTVEVITGLTGGVDAENDEGLRTRILERYRDPPGGGNWSQTAASAEASTTLVQKAFVYEAYNGPSTLFVAVAGNPSDTNKTRQISNTVISNIINPAVQSALPQYVESVVKSVVDLPASVSIGLTLPDPPTASLPGPGGGWVDANPFPTYALDGFTGATVITSSSNITIRSDLAPVAGTSRIVWVDRSDWSIHKTTVLSYSVAGANLFNCVLQDPLSGIVVGDWIFPEAENIDNYITALLNVFATLGPGEKTSQVSLLPRAYRKPLSKLSWSSSLGPSIFNFISNVDENIEDVQFLYRSLVTPPIPAVDDGPYILTPLQIGFYPNPE